MNARLSAIVCLLVLASVASVAVTTASATAADPTDRCFEPEPPAIDPAPSSDGPTGERITALTPPPAMTAVESGSAIPDALSDSSAVKTALSEGGSTILDIVGVTPLVAGYSRFGDTDPLAHETRQSIYETVREDPGIYVAELARVTDTPVSTVRYHTRVLLDAGLVEQQSERGRNRLVPAQMDTDAVVSVEGTRRDILVALDDHGPATGSDLSSRLGLSKSTVSYHLDRLEADGLVQRDRSGRTVTNDATAAAMSILGAVADD